MRAFPHDEHVVLQVIEHDMRRRGDGSSSVTIDDIVQATRFKKADVKEHLKSLKQKGEVMTKRTDAGKVFIGLYLLEELK